MDVKDLPPEERTKIAALLSKDSKDDIEWMYKKDKEEDPEVFLLGKRVPDVEQLQQITQEYEETPVQRLSRIDMQLKYREDPLTLMKQREMEKRLELLQNTAKVKRLRRLLTMQKSQKHKRKDKHKKRHKHRRRSRSRSPSSSSSESSSSGDEILNKFIKIVSHSDQKESAHVEPMTAAPEQKPAPSSSNNRQAFGSGPSRSTMKPKPETRPRLSKEEIEARRTQMARDAEEHNKNRVNRATHHYHTKEEEERRQSYDRSRHGASFLSHLKNDHVQRSSIEEGVHRKASSRQRGEMNSDFFKR